MRSYTKVILEPTTSQLFTAKFAKDFEIAGDVMEWKHSAHQGDLALYNLLIQGAYIYIFDIFPAGLLWNVNGSGSTQHSGAVYNGETPTAVYSGSSQAIASLGYNISDYSDHSEN